MTAPHTVSDVAPTQALGTEIIDSIDLPIMIVARDCTVASFNRAAATFFSLSSSDVGRSPFEIPVLSDVKRLEELCGDAMAHGASSQGDLRDSTGSWFVLRIAPYQEADDRIAGAVLTLTNVTAVRASLEQAVYEREYAKAIINTVIDPLLVLDDDLQIQTANHAFYEMFEVSREETQGVRLDELGNRDWTTRLRTFVKDSRSGNGQFDAIEVDHEFPTTGRRTVWLKARRLSRQGSAGQMTLLSIHDITERKRAEVLLNSQKQALQLLAEDASLQTVLEFLISVVERESADGMLAAITLLNEAGTHFLRGMGTSLPEEFNAAVEGVAVNSPSGLCAHALTLREPLAVYDFNEDTRWQPFGEFVAPYGLRSGWSTPLISSSGLILGTFANYFRYACDPTPKNRELVEMVTRTAAIAIERKRAEELRERLLANEHHARKQADEANRVKDEFLATVSHELRTPLNAILGWAHMLKRGALDEATTTQGLEVITRNALAQNQLISDLLDVSRIISGQLRCEMGAVDLIPVIEAAVDAIRPAADAKAVELTLTFDSAAGMVSGDAGRLQQIVLNLLTNAVKFTSRNGHVDVQLKSGERSVVIIVSDTGEGIRPDFLPYIFDRFRQAEGTASRQHGGLGLGLGIVRHLVELHGGTVCAASDGIGRGATFTAMFPLIAVSREETGMTSAQVSKNESNNSSFALKGMRVLVVDDEPDARDLVTMALTQGGAEVRASATASEGLEVLYQWKPDVLVSDIGMPGEDGYELIKKVRALEPEHGGTIPAVALTGYASDDDAVRARLAGYELHLPKPVSPSDLIAKLASLVIKP
jgi:PAS domain S-box-containing protein